MSNNKLEFPVGFDLDSGVKKAERDTETALKRLQRTIDGKPLTISANFDTSKFVDFENAFKGTVDNIKNDAKTATKAWDDYYKDANHNAANIKRISESMKELEKAWKLMPNVEKYEDGQNKLTAAAQDMVRQYNELSTALGTYGQTLSQIAKNVKRAADEEVKAHQKRAEAFGKLKGIMSAEETSIKAITEKLKIYQERLKTLDVGSDKFNKTAMAIRRLSTELEKANEKVKKLTSTAAQKHKEQEDAVRRLNAEYRSQTTYVERLIKRMAVYASTAAILQFVRRVKDVTAEFELQRISLGAIIQDQQKANQLFSQIKSFALKSPLKIMDLVTYTKQVAAYRIETDKLFDTTKRLADVSVGLGVDMQRIVLAYGQTKAASYLRAAEIRQYTEAGIPMLELLAQKFSDIEGHAVSTEEVMAKVSKRLVSFGMVEEIFKDMTDAGGIFYNMQEKQSQTLYGMYAKLGDAASIMYNEIGNTAVINGALKFVTELLQDLMKHWTALSSIVLDSVAAFGLYKAAVNGIIPMYNLTNMRLMDRIKHETELQALEYRRIQTVTGLGRAEASVLLNEKKLSTAQWERYITEGKLTTIQKLKLAWQSRGNAELIIAIRNTKLFTDAELANIAAMSKWGIAWKQMWTGLKAMNWVTIKDSFKFFESFKWKLLQARIQGVGVAFKALGRAMLSFAPLAVLTAALGLFMDWRNSIRNQEEALKKVNEKYEETRQILQDLNTAWKESFSDESGDKRLENRLEIVKQIVKQLERFGLKYRIDLTLLNADNVNEMIGKWLTKLDDVNNLSKKWGEQIALVRNAYQGDLFGWSIFGENLDEDMKDLSRSWSKLTVNKEFTDDLKRMRSDIDALASKNRETYDTISKAVGMDAKLSISQRKRNESELEYQQRVLRNYEAIRKATGNWKLTGIAGAKLNYKALNTTDFESDLKEVMHEIKKTIGVLNDEDPMTIRMAIDEQWTLNEWEDWQKELVIQELNKDRLSVGLELIPSLSSNGVGNIIEGLKAIVSTEFPSLLTENDLKSISSIDGVLDAINGKLDEANKKIKATVLMQNNVVYGSKEYKKTEDAIKKLNGEIAEIEEKRARYEELKKNEAALNDRQLNELSGLELQIKDIDEGIVKTKKAQVDALIKANGLYDEQIRKQKESAEAEREIALAAKERISQMGFTDLARDVKANFGGIMVDNLKSMTSNNYSTRFMLSDDDIGKIKDVGDLYDKWASATKAITDEEEKLKDVGIDENTIAAERLELEKKKNDLQAQYAAVEKELETGKWSEVSADMKDAELQLSMATSQKAYEDAEARIHEIRRRTLGTEYSILELRKESIKASINDVVLAQAAQDQIQGNLDYMEKAKEEWKKLGERYNFSLVDKSKKGGSEEDPWIILMKNRSAFMKDFQAGVENLNKTMERNIALGSEQDIMTHRGASLGIDVKTLDGTRKELVDWYDDAIEQVKKKIYGMGGKLWAGLGVQAILAKDTKSRMIKKYQELLQELFNAQTDFQTAKLQKDMEEKLKALSEQVAKSKAAKEFFDKVFEQTQDYNLSVNLALSAYGEAGEDLASNIRAELENAFGSIDISSAFNADNIVNYSEIKKIFTKMKNEIPEKQREVIQKILDNEDKLSAKRVETWLKDIEKAETFADKRVKLAQQTKQRIAEIDADANLTLEQKKKMKQGEKDKEAKEVTNLEYEAFKDSPMYVQMFDDLDNASTKMLKNMKKKLTDLKASWSNLDPKQLKEMQSRLKEIDAQLSKRNPFSAIIKSLKEWRSLRKNGDSNGSKSESEAETKLKNAADAAQKAQEKLNETLEDGNSTTEDIANAREELNKAMGNEENAENALEQWKKVKDTMTSGAQEVLEIFKSLGGIASGIADVMENFGAEEEDVQYWRDIADSVNKITGGIDGIVQSAMSGSISGVITSAITAVPNLIIGVGNLFGGYAGKVKKANKEIKKQQKLLDNLAYAYGRLETALEQALGGDYISNYKQQIKNLEAQQQAYMAQYEAEKSKGKKKDEDKMQEYLDAAQEVADQIADMKSQISEEFLGSDLASAAKDFAQAWLDAYKEFSNTASALQEEFQDMIENMVVNSVLAEVMQKALQPVFDAIDNMSETDFYNQNFWKNIVSLAEEGAAAANEGATTMMKFLEQSGISIRDTTSDLTGLSRDIATASEESINGLAAGINTQNYYIAQIWAYVKMIAEGGSGTTPLSTESVSLTDLVTLMNTHLAYLPNIAQNTLDTAERCERAAVACENIAAKVNRVVSARGVKSGYVVNVQ